jgi:hypothetical protein
MHQHLIDHVLERLEANEKTSHQDSFDRGGPVSVEVQLIQACFLRLASLKHGGEAPAGLATRTCQRLSLRVAEEQASFPTGSLPPVP